VSASVELKFETVIGLEVHAELATQSKMFCGCPVVDSTQAKPNTTVCPVCAGMPGVLPVVNRQAVEFAIRVGLALQCQIRHTSIFARKNYFYPDLPKGYQISQYEFPLAQNGRLEVHTPSGSHVVRINRVHMEEDAGKLTHVHNGGGNFTLVDLNRAGLPLLEIVTEPDMHSVEEARAYATSLRSILRCLGVNSGDMEKGVIRFEANISLRPVGESQLGKRVEIKNLNSFRALERSVTYEIERQAQVLRAGGEVEQETRGWNEERAETYVMRSKEEAHDYRYFPEPDLPPLIVEDEWIERVRASLPELPAARQARFQSQYGLSDYDAGLLIADQAIADYFEDTLRAVGNGCSAKTAANWVLGELFALVNQNGGSFDNPPITPAGLADLLGALERGEINASSAKSVLAEMYTTGKRSAEIIAAHGMAQISDTSAIAEMVSRTLSEHSKELTGYLAGKETLSHWFFGQVMRAARGQANPQVVQDELNRQLEACKKKASES
jgi:aspartyl-tRNA(Asn)/glutamyl-tRNA(Gln) amidotransferase subunit B